MTYRVTHMAIPKIDIAFSTRLRLKDPVVLIPAFWRNCTVKLVMRTPFHT